MAVVPDTEPVAVLAVVEVLVLVAQDGRARLVVGHTFSSQRGDLAGLGVLVRIGTRGTGQSDPLAELRSPEAGGGHHHVGIEVLTCGGPDTDDAPAPVQDVGHLVVSEEPGAALDGAFGLCGGGTQCHGQAVGGSVETAQHPVRIEQGMQGLALRGVDQPALNSPGLRPPRVLQDRSSVLRWWPPPARRPG